MMNLNRDCVGFSEEFIRLDELEDEEEDTMEDGAKETHVNPDLPLYLSTSRRGMPLAYNKFSLTLLSSSIHLYDFWFGKRV